MTGHLRAVGSPHESRYQISNPPDQILGILRRFAKATREPEYRAHGGYLNGDMIRAQILKVVRVEIGDADDIGRFLKKQGVLKSDRDESEPGVVWAFESRAADELLGALVQTGHVPPQQRDISSYCDRASDPGTTSGEHLTNGRKSNGASIAEALTTGTTTPSPRVYSFPEQDYDDGMLQELDAELAKKIAEMQAERSAITEELDRRKQERDLKAELAALAKREADHKRELLGIEERRLEIEAKRKALAANSQD